MLLRTLFALLVSVIVTGCGPHYVDYFPYHDDGTIKPHVALLPMYDELDVPLPFNASIDMTNIIHYELMDSGQLYLLPYCDIKEGLAKIGTVDFCGSDQALAEQFGEADFIVLIELINHKTDAANNSGLSQLTMKARLKIIDARCRKPRIALQEFICREYIVQGFTGIYETDSEHYEITYGRAHRWFADAISRRLEEVIRSVF